MFFEKNKLIPYPEILLKLNPVEGMALTKFHDLSLSNKAIYIGQLIDEASVDFIVKLAIHDADFFSQCELANFDEEWASLWSTYGIIITGNQEKALYDQENSNKFKLFLGVYFYNKSKEALRLKKTDYSDLELSYLQKAMEYNSIHAVQRFHCYLYAKISSVNNSSSLISIFENIILQCKKLLADYQSYAYMMLCEAYTRYGLCLKNTNSANVETINLVISAAHKSCDIAEQLFDESQASIFNASLGGSIADSNTEKLSNFNLIKENIDELFEDKPISSLIAGS